MSGELSRIKMVCTWRLMPSYDKQSARGMANIWCNLVNLRELSLSMQQDWNKQFFAVGEAMLGGIVGISQQFSGSRAEQTCSKPFKDS